MRLSLKNTSEVCHYFANQVQNEGYCGNVSFKGTDFYSYRTIVAKRINGFIVMSDYSYSITTSSHLSDLWQACRHKNIIYIPKVEDSAATNKANIEHEVNELFKLASTARTKKDFYLSKAFNIAKQFNQYCGISDNKQYIIDLGMFENVDLATIRANKARDIANMTSDAQRKATKNAESDKLLAAAKVYNAGSANALSNILVLK